MRRIPSPYTKFKQRTKLSGSGSVADDDYSGGLLRRMASPTVGTGGSDVSSSIPGSHPVPIANGRPADSAMGTPPRRAEFDDDLERFASTSDPPDIKVRRISKVSSAFAASVKIDKSVPTRAVIPPVTVKNDITYVMRFGCG